MRKIVFIAHDPGGCEAMYPVFKKMEQDSCFLALGPSATIYPEYAAGENDWGEILQRLADDKSLAGVVMGRNWGTDLDVRLLSWARKRRVRSIVILDYWSNYASSFCSNGEQYWPDAYLLMDELAKQEAVAEGVPADIIRIVGQPGLDKFYNMRGNYSPPDKDVLFLSQPLSLLYGDSIGYTEQGVLADVQKACQACGRKLEVKFHPKDDENFQQQYQDIAVTGDVDKLMRHYKLVIGMSSMALLHAALMNVPIVSYQPNLRGDDGCITNRLGLSYNINHYEKLMDVLSGRYNCLTLNSDRLEELLWLDGKSANRTVNAVMSIVMLRSDSNGKEM